MRYIFSAFVAVFMLCLLAVPSHAQDNLKKVCKMDYNHDGIVNISDFNIFRNKQAAKEQKLLTKYQKHFGQTCSNEACRKLDLNNDNLVNAQDFNLARNKFLDKQSKKLDQLRNNFGQTCTQ